MGIDLKLLPLINENYCETVLSLDRRRELFTQITNEGKPHKLETKILSYFEDVQVYYDEYDEILTYLTASDLMDYVYHEDVLDSSANCAAWAYISQLESTTKIVLYWS